jgi:hypothetical protein
MDAFYIHSLMMTTWGNWCLYFFSANIGASLVHRVLSYLPSDILNELPVDGSPASRGRATMGAAMGWKRQHGMDLVEERRDQTRYSQVVEA